MRYPVAQMPRVMQEAFEFKGGLDLVSPALAQKPGSLISSVNFEPDINGGYRRMYGIERFDGRSRPSDANYWVAACSIFGSVSVGNTVTGQSSGATGVVLQVNGTTEMILTATAGTFTEGESFMVSAAIQGTISVPQLNAALTPALHAQYKNLAADYYRNLIAAVPGSGPVRGVWYYSGTVYAFRNNVGGTQCLMYKSTSSGWVQVTFGVEIQFSAATGQIFEGDTITCGGQTGVVRRALLRTGTWSSAGAGTLVMDSVSGTMPTTTSITVGGTGKATSASASTAITLQPGGRFEFSNFNFAGTTATYRMYFVDGVNYLHEFDGTRLIPIRTGISPDAPKFLATWRNRIFVSVASSVQMSGIGAPYSWTALTGAAEIALGATCAGLLPQPGDASSGAMAVFTDKRTHILYDNAGTFSLALHADEYGAQPYTVQNIGSGYWLDSRGIVGLATSQNFGNFEAATLSRKIQPMIDSKRGKAVASCIVRGTNQYRVFFNDGTGIIMTPGQAPAFMPFDYGTNGIMQTVVSQVDDAGVERIFAGGANGYVYELDVGTSLDGANIVANFLTTFNFSRGPRTRKNYLRTAISASAKNTATVQVGYDLSYGDADSLSGAQSSLTNIGGGGYWDQFTWDTINWDSPYVSEYIMDTPGNGTNFSLMVSSDTDLDEPFSIQSAIIHYKQRRQER